MEKEVIFILIDSAIDFQIRYDFFTTNNGSACMAERRRKGTAMEDLLVTLVQTGLVWENRNANLALLDRCIDGIENETHLIVLPEMFNTGFTMNASALAEAMDGPTVDWMTRKAVSRGAAIVGSLIIQDAGRYYNRLVWAGADGTCRVYDKRHLFRMMGEHAVYTAGDTRLTVSFRGWRIRFFICYDLRFPVWTRNFENGYDVSLFVANWPAKRAAHWRALLTARAIENQSYVIGVNRTGTDGIGNGFSGGSCVIDPAGEAVFSGGDTPIVHTQRLSADFLQSYRESFPAWKDADVPPGAE
jgi:omega-amidase